MFPTAPSNGLSGCRSLRIRLFLCIVLFIFAISASAQATAKITDVSIRGDMVRLLLQASPSEPDLLYLQEADSPGGPWIKEPEVQRTTVAGGYEFLTPHRPYFPHRYYRVGLFSFSPVAAQNLPFIRFISPNINISPGQLVTLLGANFDPTPGGNEVLFELANQSWTATVSEAATNFLMVRVPTNLLANPFTATVYRVSVKTIQGAGNGVAAPVQIGFANFSIRPQFSYIAQPPGPGKQVLVIGGGTPPYKLMPLTDFEQKNAIVTLNGPVLEVTAMTNTRVAGITLRVQDSSPNFPNQGSANVTIITVPYRPNITAEFHTLLAGTEPGMNLLATLSESSQGNFQTEQMQLELQNLGIDLSHLHSGEIVGLLQLFDPGGPYYYSFAHLLVTDVTVDKATFEVISLDDGGSSVVAKGAFVVNPPTVVIDVLNLPPSSLVPQPLYLKLVLTDRLFELPAAPDSDFSIVTHFTSVSSLEDKYFPQEASVTNKFKTSGIGAGAPRIERLLPVQGEIFRHVRIRGSGFSSDLAAGNSVTFAGAGGTRVPAEVVEAGSEELVVAVPPGAITGPVHVGIDDKTSNDFLFAVRFRPDTSLFMDNFTPNTPATLHLLHQQPQDEHETSDEIAMQSVHCTISGGHLALSNVSSNQQVGTFLVANSFVERKSTNLLLYAGQETSGLKRHIFKGATSLSSSFVLARLFISENEDGVTLDLAGGDPLFQFGAGIAYEFAFTTPVYAPPANEVSIHVEAISKPYTSIPGNEMRVIWNSTQRPPG